MDDGTQAPVRECVVIDEDTGARYLVTTGKNGEDYPVPVVDAEVDEATHSPSNESVMSGKDAREGRTFENTQIMEMDDMDVQGDNFGAIQLSMDIDHQTSVDFTGFGEVRVTQNDSPNRPRSPYLALSSLPKPTEEERVSGFLSPEKGAAYQKEFIQKMRQHYYSSFKFKEQNNSFRNDLRNLRELEDHVRPHWGDC